MVAHRHGQEGAFVLHTWKRQNLVSMLLFVREESRANVNLEFFPLMSVPGLRSFSYRYLHISAAKQFY